MRSPTRLRISWRDDTTMLVESDYGTQTRVLQFMRACPEGGRGKATPWRPGTVRRVAAVPHRRPRRCVWQRQPQGSHNESPPRYLRKNGVPYSGDLVLTEMLGRSRRPVASGGL